MAELTKNEMLRIVNENISRLKNKDFNIYFFVLDTKGNPTSSLEYIYQTALVLHRKGYNVSLLHQENEFIGVREWLGDEYADLPHLNIEKDNVEITPSDFIFIPENDGSYSIMAADANNMPAEVVIPSSHEGKPVTAIAQRGFYGCSSINSILLPESITSVGASAFYECFKLVEVINMSQSLEVEYNDENGKSITVTR